jgi:hypothetical protein
MSKSEHGVVVQNRLVTRVGLFHGSYLDTLARLRVLHSASMTRSAWTMHLNAMIMRGLQKPRGVHPRASRLLVSAQ